MAREDYKVVAELLLVDAADVNAKTPPALAKTEEMKALLRKYGAR
jgi:hypothetical protein